MRVRRCVGTGAACSVVALALVSCSSGAGTGSGTGAPAGSTSGPAAASTGAGASAPPAHVVVVIEENHGEDQIAGSPDAPYLNSLIAEGTLFDRASGVTHPSEPNYLALFSGSTHGLTDDACPPPGAPYAPPDLASELAAAGRSFTGYAQGMVQAGSATCRRGEYARKHVPWADFSGIPPSESLPFTAFPQRDFTGLPTVAFVVPDLVDDMHDGTVAEGDQWLRRNIGPYATWAMTHDSMLIVTWDEDEGTAANRIPLVVTGAHVPRGVSHAAIDHYGVLRMIEDLYGVTRIGMAASAPAPPRTWG